MEDMKRIEMLADHKLGLQKAGGKRRSRALKIFGVMFIVSMLAITATGGLLTYFAKWDTNITVAQAVTVTGGPMGYDGPLNAGCCECIGPFTATNNGCEEICLDFITTNLTDGLTVSVKECEEGTDPTDPTPIPCELAGVKLNVLDGQATGDDDDYSVYVDGQFAGSYDATEGGDEFWVESFFDISALHIVACGTHTVKVVCDATTPWAGYATWGQLAVDWISLYRDCPTCQDPVLCETVDIGDPTDEADNNLVGWSDFIAGATYNGGNYGGIDDARCTWWDSEENWATVDLTCDCIDCGEIPGEPGTPSGECDCDDPSMAMPMCLQPGETIDFCICYEADIMMEEGQFHLETTLVPAQA